MYTIHSIDEWKILNENDKDPDDILIFYFILNLSGRGRRGRSSLLSHLIVLLSKYYNDGRPKYEK